MSWLSIIPPLLAIAVVFWRREVILALLVALVSAELLIIIQTDGAISSVLVNTIDRIISVLTSAGNTRILLFSLLIGGLLALIRDSGGVNALVNRLLSLGMAKSKRQAGGLTFFTGVAIFIESNLSILASGILARGLFDKYKMSRARLAYIIDSTSGPICVMILLNAWGAYVLGLLQQYPLSSSPVSVLWGSVAFNFYAIITLLIVLYTIISDKTYGPMQRAEQASISAPSPIKLDEPQDGKARFMLLPLLVLVGATIGFMLWTGNGDITAGSGSRSVLYATVIALLLCFVLLLSARRFTHEEAMNTTFKGMGELLPLVTIVLLSISLGASLKLLGTGAFVASLVGAYLPLVLVAPVLFIAGGIISFTTGTSWGTFAILVPIGMPIVQEFGIPPELILGAILGGGIFGDHCSPISDTTAVSSLAAGTDILTHVETQLPYALFAGVLSIIGFLIASLFML